MTKKISDALMIQFHSYCAILKKVSKLNDYELTIAMLQQLIGMRDLIERVKTVEKGR